MSKLRLNLNITTLLQKYKSLEAGAYNKKLDSKTDIHCFKIDVLKKKCWFEIFLFYERKKGKIALCAFSAA